MMMLKYYKKYSNPENFSTVMEAGLGYKLRDDGIKWSKNSFSLTMQVITMIRFAFIYFYWKGETVLDDVISNWFQFWRLPRPILCALVWILFSSSITSRIFCLVQMKRKEPNFKLVLKPFSILTSVTPTSQILTSEYKEFVVEKTKKLLFLYHIGLKVLNISILPVYLYARVTGLSKLHLFSRVLWAFQLRFCVMEFLRHTLAVMFIIYVSCLTVAFMVQDDKVKNQTDSSEDLMRKYQNLVQALTWLGRTNESLRVLIGIFVATCWTVTLLFLHMLTFYRTNFLVLTVASFFAVEIGCSLVIILITVSSASLSLQRTIRRYLDQLPRANVSDVHRMKFNNILSLAMARNAFSCFDFFEVKQQFIMTVL